MRVFSTSPKLPRGGRGGFVFFFFPFFCPFSCWLNTEGGFIWSFVGPVCVIILVGVLLQKRGKNGGRRENLSIFKDSVKATSSEPGGGGTVLC